MSTRSLFRSMMLGLALVAWPFLAAANAALDWNETAIGSVNTARQLGAISVRSMAMVHAAMFDAVNATQPRYQAFKYKGPAPAGASADAAAATAAHAVLVKLFPDQKAKLDETLAAALAKVPAGASRDDGAAAGRASAEALLAWCADDGVGAPYAWRPITKPGVYVPTAITVGDDFANSRPWMLKSRDQFRPPPPPALTSATWARDYNEIRSLGGRASTARSQEQTQVGQFWIVTGAPAYNSVMRQALIQKNTNLLDSARLLALAYIAQTDALVAVFDAKYHYNLWRPVTAIRNGDQHDNPAVQREATWLPLVDTPMHPEYPCAHCISAASALSVLQSQLGDNFSVMTMTSPTAPGVTRRWERLSDVVQEVSNARVWSGVHYRFSTEAGMKVGKDIGAYAVANYMQPLR
jgi:hypothetical protein